jgi:hypothetical protein
MPFRCCHLDFRVFPDEGAPWCLGQDGCADPPGLLVAFRELRCGPACLSTCACRGVRPRESSCIRHRCGGRLSRRESPLSRLGCSGTPRTSVPSSGFLTPSTALAHCRFRACCVPVPDRIRCVSGHARPDVRRPLVDARLSRQRVHTLRRVAPHWQPCRITTAVASSTFASLARRSRVLRPAWHSHASIRRGPLESEDSSRSASGRWFRCAPKSTSTHRGPSIVWPAPSSWRVGFPDCTSHRLRFDPPPHLLDDGSRTSWTCWRSRARRPSCLCPRGRPGWAVCKSPRHVGVHGAARRPNLVGLPQRAP